jgi:hypothetical protein
MDTQTSTPQPTTYDAVNDPQSVHFWVARAVTNADWQKVNRMAHALLEDRMEQVSVGLVREDDPTLAMFNSLAVLSNEVVERARLNAMYGKR